ncbi:hypothetical protein ES708_09017 [subsurface metagenome]
MFPQEDIPDTCKLYYRIHKTNIVNNNIIPGAFKERGTGDKKGMSTDWGKYSIPIQTRNRAEKPKLNGVINFVVEKLRRIELEVIHWPKEDNQSHTNVRGIDKAKNRIRLELLGLYNWEIDCKFRC